MLLFCHVIRVLNIGAARLEVDLGMSWLCSPVEAAKLGNDLGMTWWCSPVEFGGLVWVDLAVLIV